MLRVDSHFKSISFFTMKDNFWSFSQQKFFKSYVLDSTNMLLNPPICQKNHVITIVITPKCCNSQHTNFRIVTTFKTSKILVCIKDRNIYILPTYSIKPGLFICSNESLTLICKQTKNWINKNAFIQPQILFQCWIQDHNPNWHDIEG